MRSIIFDSTPLDINAMHDAKGSAAGINGALVFYYSAVRAMLEHSRYERFIFLSCREHHPFSLANSEQFRNLQREIRIVHPTEINTLQDIGEVVLVTSTERLGPLLRLRRMFEEERVPAIGFLHATHPTWLGPFLVEMVFAGVTDFDALVCSSLAGRTVLQSLLGLLCGQSRSGIASGPQTPLIPLAIDCNQFKGRSEIARRDLGFAEDQVVILFFGRFDTSGKCDLGPLLLAFSRLKRKLDRPVRLVLAGADRDKLSQSLNQLAGELGCADAVLIQPNPSNEDKLRLFGAADIFVSPSEAVPESFGITAIEAMASGLPCVVSDWNGYRETVVHGQTGFLVPTAWSDLGPCIHAFESCGIGPESTLAATTVVEIDGLEHYLQLLIENADLRRQMALVARQYVQAHFDWSVVVPQYDHLFDLQRQSARRPSVNDIARAEIALRSSTQPLFSHYPSETLTLDSSLLLTSVGKKWTQSPFKLGVALNKQELISESLSLEIARVLEGGSLAMGDLMHAASAQTGAAPWVVKINIMRLLKYGILGARESQSDRLGKTAEAVTSLQVV